MRSGLRVDASLRLRVAIGRLNIDQELQEAIALVDLQAMLVVGTPRPSSSVLDDLSNSGLFESPGGSGFQDEYSLDCDDEDFDDTERLRTRSESFHEMFENEKVQGPPIVLAGEQPLLARHLNIVKNLKPKQVAVKERGAPKEAELAAEEALLADETAARERWSALGGRGCPELGLTSKAVSERSKKSFNQALVPLTSSEGENIHLLPHYEERVRILVVGDGDNTAICPRMELRNETLPDVVGRRIACQIWIFHPCGDSQLNEQVFDAYLRGTDALVATSTSVILSSRSILSKAAELNKVIVLGGLYAGSQNETRKLGSSLQAHIDTKGSSWMEIAARHVALATARQRGESRATISAMEKQLRKSEKAKSPSRCVIM